MYEKAKNKTDIQDIEFEASQKLGTTWGLLIPLIQQCRKMRLLALSVQTSIPASHLPN